MRLILLMGVFCIASGLLPALAQTPVTRESGAVVTQTPIRPASGATSREAAPQNGAIGTGSSDVMDLAIAVMKGVDEAQAGDVREVAEELRAQQTPTRQVPDLHGEVCVANCPPKQ